MSNIHDLIQRLRAEIARLDQMIAADEACWTSLQDYRDQRRKCEKQITTLEAARKVMNELGETELTLVETEAA